MLFQDMDRVTYKKLRFYGISQTVRGEKGRDFNEKRNEWSSSAVCLEKKLFMTAGRAGP